MIGAFLAVDEGRGQCVEVPVTARDLGGLTADESQRMMM